MLSTTLMLTAALFSSARFGPNDTVMVEAVGEGARITAYGDTQIVKIVAEDFELQDCQETLRDKLNPGRCLFSEGGLITLSRDPEGTRLTFQDAKRGSSVEFVVDLAGRERAAKALSP
ncbi:hypothetical protein [Dokdonella sp.]|uniref:hypothetical protein n=1 Tax=Dokdonella sp. TaxID=2291710 RepID=UPI003C5D3A0E